MGTESPTRLRLPGPLGQLVTGISIPSERSNHLFVFQFMDAQESLFDTRKGLFLSPPTGVLLPSRKELKFFGKMLEKMRDQLVEPAHEKGADQSQPFSPEFSVYSVCG